MWKCDEQQFQILSTSSKMYDISNGILLVVRPKHMCILVRHICIIYIIDSIRRKSLQDWETKFWKRNTWMLDGEWEKRGNTNSMNVNCKVEWCRRSIYSNDGKKSIKWLYAQAAISFSYDRSVENAVRRIYGDSAFVWIPRSSTNSRRFARIHTHLHTFHFTSAASK